MQLQKQKVLLLIALLFFLTACQSVSEDDQVTLTVSAAISLTDALAEIKEAYEEENDIQITYNLAGSGTLSQQIQQGAPVDLFISANEQWMEALEEKELIIPETLSDLTGNNLVLIAHKDTTLHFDTFEEIASDGTLDITVGNPESVPAGAYAKDALMSLGIWEEVYDQAILAKDVRQIVTYIETGNADLGFVYESDAKSSSDVQVVAPVKTAHHEPIRYPVAITANTEHEEEAKAFLAYLLSEDAQRILATYGFNK